VRGLETHKRKTERAVPGSRTAVNVGGIDHGLIFRGSVLAHPGMFTPTRRLDVAFRLLSDASRSLQHNVEVKLFIGAAETLARVRLLGAQELKPGDRGWLQLEPREPVVAVRGDRYILRRPSPGETIGGGAVLDAHPKGRSKRFDENVLARLAALARGSARDVFLQAVLAAGAASLTELLDRNSLDRDAILNSLHALSAEGGLLVLGDAQDNDPLVAARAHWEGLIERAVGEVSMFHQTQPLRRGMSREELRNKLDLSEQIFAACIKNCVEVGSLAQDGPLVFLPGHAIKFTPEQENAINHLISQFAAQPFTPPTVKECIAALDDNVYQALLDLKKLVQVSPEVVFRREDHERMVAGIRRLAGDKGNFTAAEVRDHFKTTRRYALALLEHLDAEGVTVREGIARRLK
jgi:selenocysteine-specific elongation factor